MATIVDFILEEDKEAYLAIIERAAEAKANAPKRAKVVTPEQLIAREENKLLKLQAKLEALRAAQTQASDE